MARQPKIVSDATLADALLKHAGNISHAAKACKISRQSVHERIGRTPALQEAIRAADDRLLDIAEGHTVRYVKRGDKDMVRYVLDRKGRKRGWGNSVSVGFDDAQAEAFIGSLGGNIQAYRDLLAQLGVNQSEIP